SWRLNAAKALASLPMMSKPSSANLRRTSGSCRMRQRMADRIGKVGVVGAPPQVAHIGNHEAAGHTGALDLGNRRFGKIPNAQAVAVIALGLVGPALLHREVCPL